MASFTCLVIHGIILSTCPLLQGQGSVTPTWTSWDEWVNILCPATCSGFTTGRVRSRECKNASIVNDIHCEGLPFESENVTCGTEPCFGWSNWNEWTFTETCSVTCGGGTTIRLRIRQCEIPVNAEENCPGLPFEYENVTCGTNPCQGVIDGVWTDWGEWGSLQCSATCGGSVMGTATRRRTCSNPSPQDGGKSCGGERIQSQKLDCKLTDCPGSGWVPGGFAALSEEAQRVVIGIVIAVGIFLILLIILIIFLLCRRKKRRERRESRLLTSEYQQTLPKGSTSGTASRSKFKEGQWNRAFDNPSS